MIPSKKQQGLGLLELLLVLTISALVIIMGFRAYLSNKKLADVELLKQDAKILLHAADSYYYAYCIQNLDGPSAGMPGDTGLDALTKAKTMLNADLTAKDLQTTNEDGYQFMSSDFHFNNPFGQFNDGAEGDDQNNFKIAFEQMPYSSNDCASQSDGTKETANCFGQTALWKAKVSACLTAFTTKQYDKRKKQYIYTLPDPEFVKTMFGADDVTQGATTGENHLKGDESCKNGVVVSWTSVPRYREKALTSGEDLLTAGNTLHNQQYRYGPWMQQGYLAEGKGGPALKERLDYLCQ